MLVRGIQAAICALMCVNALEAGILENWSAYVMKQEARPATIKVLVAQNKPGIVLEVRGKYKIYDPNTMEHISTRFMGKRKFLQPLSNGIKWGEEFPGIYQILIVADEPNSTTIVDGVEYAGNLYIYDVAGQISVVNELAVEDYLDSLLSVKYDAPYPEEYLGAIAIASRTQAYDVIGNPKTKYWDIDGTKIGFEGYAATQKQNGIDKALLTTRNMVMTLNDKPFDASWEAAKIKPLDAERLAKSGDSAAQILNKAFPGMTLKVIGQ